MKALICRIGCWGGFLIQIIRLMIEILHDFKDPKLWELGNYGICLVMGNAGYISSTAE